MSYFIVALLVTCVAPDGIIFPCHVIENSILGGSTLFLTKEKCLTDIGDSKRRTCVEQTEPVKK